ncbi:efflux RND transporter periplasmic adaptor subunit [Nevskia sp.]|uniref:efflux RND transporter periplasmic adaptor subunit n=1 Tax=Nevskia sp. TaxID=1929292 RepID=UPI0025FA9223|nr:efflux RND transporter periplasmic adaptor subunit [Nevskia sp.]
MDDRAALLNQLRIDRSDEPADGGGKPWLKWLIALVLLALLGIAAWIYLAPPPGLPVTVAVARPASSGGASGGSLLDAAGYVVARRAATVSAKITGLVTEVLIEEGSKVEANQIVARLDDTNIRASLEQSRAQLESAKAQAAQVRVNVANAERDVTRRKGLVEQKFISVAELDTAQTTLDGLRASLTTAERNMTVSARAVDVAQRAFDDTTVRAPFAGVITVKAAQVGEIVSPLSAGGGFTRTGIGTVVDMDSLEVEVDVNENFINRVKAAQPAVIKLNAYPDWSIPASVIAVIPTADRTKATVKVRVAFKERDDRVLPEMGARVSFLSEAPAAGAAAPTGVIVPADAVLGTGEKGAVFLLKGETVERRAVKLGARNGADQTVIAGLNAGDRMVIGDLAKLKDGDRVRIAVAAP